MPTQPPNRVRFPMDFRHRIYLCRECHNHVLNVPTHNSNLVFRVPYVLDQSAEMEGEVICDTDMAGGVICDAGGMAVNVRFGCPSCCWFRNGLPAVNVYCIQCHSSIGERLIWYCRIRCTPSEEVCGIGMEDLRFPQRITGRLAETTSECSCLRMQFLQVLQLLLFIFSLQLFKQSPKHCESEISSVIAVGFGRMNEVLKPKPTFVALNIQLFKINLNSDYSSNSGVVHYNHYTDRNEFAPCSYSLLPFVKLKYVGA
ncbi:hypothetical protein V6N12_019436 [Hibiscus sabdariffa]|uniref:Uncharacterized protein n=1 Tax=Hibiscus sabdariffa TaxID=183260 RepID=A0ABR2BMT0_9ROSI